MKNIKFIGRGSAFNSEEGNNSAFNKLENKLLLIDCGEVTFKDIKEKNILDGVSEVHVLITHMHSDHVGSLTTLIFYCEYILQIPIFVYGVPQFYLKTSFTISGCINQTKLSLLDIVPNKDFSIWNNSITITPIEVMHTPELFALGYVIRFKGETVYYSGDSREIPQPILNLFVDGAIDTLFQDTCLTDFPGNPHMPLSELEAVIPNHLRKSVWCMHLNGKNITNKIKAIGFSVVEIY